MLSYKVTKHGITVNNILSDSIETEQLEKLMEQQADKEESRY
ncbi:hypothetical protein [Candidatus Coxiella mudrowiae]|nr:hypothetical protein [Candidatus Coxiella mudrowiae]